MDKTRNVTGHEHCAACIDGWVELAGTIKIGQTTYTRGMAPCKWCEQGTARIQRHPELETNITGSDIVPAEHPSGRRFRPDTAFLIEREAAGDRREALQAMFPRSLWPAEWTPPTPRPNPLTEDEAAEAHEKQRLAVQALESAPQEPFSAVGPESQDSQDGEISMDEVPF